MIFGTNKALLLPTYECKFSMRVGDAQCMSVCDAKE